MRVLNLPRTLKCLPPVAAVLTHSNLTACVMISLCKQGPVCVLPLLPLVFLRGGRALHLETLCVQLSKWRSLVTQSLI